MNNLVEVKEVDRHLSGKLESWKTLDPHRNTYTRHCISFLYNYIFFLICLTSLKQEAHGQHRSVETTA